MIAKHRILVIDDEQVVCDVVKEMLSSNDNYRVVAEYDPVKALTLLKTSQFDLVLTDLMMGKYSGMQMIQAALEQNGDTVVVLMTGYPTMENAIDALKHGAYDYIVKPFKMDHLMATVERGLRKQMLARENIHLKEQLALFKIAEAMGSTIHLGTALNQVLRLTIKEFNADGASILFNESADTTRFVLQAIQTVHLAEVDREFLEGRTHHSQMAADSRVVEIENLYQDAPNEGDALEPDPDQDLPFVPAADSRPRDRHSQYSKAEPLPRIRHRRTTVPESHRLQSGLCNLQFQTL